MLGVARRLTEGAACRPKCSWTWRLADESAAASAAWQHAFGDVEPDAALAFATTGVGFDIVGVPLAKDSLLIETGFDFNVSQNATLGFAYSGQFSEGVQDNAVKGRISWRF